MLAPLKIACQALSGKRPVADDVEDEYQALSMPGGWELPLISNDSQHVGGAFVRDLGRDPSASQAEPVSDFLGSSRDLEAAALESPVLLDIQVPSGDPQPGQIIRAGGPNGPIRVKLPPGATPGATLRFKIAAKPEYRIRVPPGAGPGAVMMFRKKDGEEVRVVVPPGLQPGDTFEVTPPALMVRVPEKAEPGDYVMFSHAVSAADGKGGRTEFFRARVPEGVQPCDHFTALLPPPRFMKSRFGA